MEEQNIRPKKRSRKQELSDQMFIKSMRRMILGILLCVCCLVSTTWAWFIASADSQVFEVRLQNTDIRISTRSRARIRQNQDGEYRMPAGSYTIEAEPLSGFAAMYCLVHIRKEESSIELIEQAIDIFNEDEEQEWIPVYATDSNSIRVLESDTELEMFLEEFDEDNTFEYEILPISVMSEGTYRVDWEPEEDRRFILNLEEEAFVSFEFFWITEEEDDYPGLDEMMGYNYVILYQENKTSPSNGQSATTAAATTAATSAAAAESSSAAVTESSSAAVTESSSAATTESSSAAVTEPASTEESTEASIESSTEASSEAETSTPAETTPTESESGSQTENSQQENEPAESNEPQTETETEAVQGENDPQPQGEDSTPVPTSEDTEITPEMSSEDIENLGA